MRYVLKTEVNAKGNKVFSKVRMGKEFIYLAKAEDGSIGEVDKDWVLSNQKNIVNLGVSGDNIYPVTELDKRKRLPDGMIRCAVCGKVLHEDDSVKVYNRDTDDFIRICRHCEANGGRVNKEEYICCHGCGTEATPCWIRKADVFEVAHIKGCPVDEQYYGDALVCKDNLSTEYAYCEHCKKYFPLYPNYDGICPECGEK